MSKIVRNISVNRNLTTQDVTMYMNANISSADSYPVHDAKELTGGQVQARIVLDGQVYTLRITRANKLILTK